MWTSQSPTGARHAARYLSTFLYRCDTPSARYKAKGMTVNNVNHYNHMTQKHFLIFSTSKEYRDRHNQLEEAAKERKWSNIHSILNFKRLEWKTGKANRVLFGNLDCMLVSLYEEAVHALNLDKDRVDEELIQEFKENRELWKQSTAQILGMDSSLIVPNLKIQYLHPEMQDILRVRFISNGRKFDIDDFVHLFRGKLPTHEHVEIVFDILLRQEHKIVLGLEDGKHLVLSDEFKDALLGLDGESSCKLDEHRHIRVFFRQILVKDGQLIDPQIPKITKLETTLREYPVMI